MSENSLCASGELPRQILDFCRRIAGSSQITAISLFGDSSVGKSNVKATLEIMLVVRDFQPRLMSYLKVVGRRNIIVFAVDRWIFERDVERGFLGEALAGALIFPYVALNGRNYLHAQEIILKKRLIMELLENVALSFPELSYRIKINPRYFVYEVILNRVRVFPPLAYALSNILRGNVYLKEIDSVLSGYLQALEQLEKEKKVILSEGYVMIPKKLVVESRKPQVRLTNISKSAPRTLFTSLLGVFPQLLNFLSQNAETVQKFIKKREIDSALSFVDPQEYIFVPTAEGLVSLAEHGGVEAFAQRMLSNGENGKIKVERVGGVLNDVFLIRAFSSGTEKKVLVKRFKDWSGFKWFPLTIWSLGARKFAVMGRARIERECAISELLRCEGFNVPKVLSVSHPERLVFMEFIEGENLSNTVKRIATLENGEKAEKDLIKIARVGETFAKVHSLNVALGDTKPENVIIGVKDKVYLLDFEQASRDGDKAWDVAEFLYYSGHYFSMNNNDKAEIMARAFLRGYLKAGGDAKTINKAGTSKYTRVFSIFTLPSIIFAMSNVCKKIVTTD